MTTIFYAERTLIPDTECAVRLIFKKYYNLDDCKIERSENGKPFLVGSPYFFSVTHTKTMFFLAVSNKNVGIDAECISRETDYPPILRKFPLAEREEIDGKAEFLRHWTVRECAVKWLGGTLATDFSKLSYVKGKVFYRELSLPVDLFQSEILGHIIALCTDKAALFQPPKFVEISI